MKILVIGSGGREHGIIWKLSKNKNIEKIYAAPGNGGIANLAECVSIGAMEIKKVIEFSKEKGIDMVVVAPDDPLAAGMVDALDEAGIKAFGPKKNAAIIEASKAFSKELMKKYNIPTAGYETFDDSERALNYINNHEFPLVVKADGLALGKGVIICEDKDTAIKAIKDIMIDKVFGEAGGKVVIEEFLVGQEVTVLAFTDGKVMCPMVSSQDHKRAYDGDKGLNTGGMGTFSPSRIYTKELAKECMEKIFIPTMKAMNKEGRTFKGVIYFGLIITKDGPKIIEYNARFGDPETQVVLPRLKTDLLEIFDAIISETLSDINIEWSDNAAVCVVITSGGYPVNYKKGYKITGLDNAEKDSNIIVFHAGTKLENGEILTNGGRVLGVTAIGEDLDIAIKKSYDAVSKITFKDAHYRKDIGIK